MSLKVEKLEGNTENIEEDKLKDNQVLEQKK